MSLSGICIADEVMKIFAEMKNKQMYKYIVFKMNDDQTSIDVEKSMKSTDCDVTDEKGNDVECWTKLRDELPDNEPRYILYDVMNKQKDGRPLQRIVFIAWCQDTCPVKLRMCHASSKEALKKKFDGIMAVIQASDADEMEYSELLAKAQKS